MLQAMKSKIASLFKGGFFHIFVGNTMVKMIAFISSIVIVRLVDKTNYAYLTYADNLYNYVISFAGLGMVSSVLKFCASAKTKEEDKAYFAFAMKYGTLFEAALSVVVVIYVSWGVIPFPEARTITYMLVLYPLLNNIISTIMSYLRAHGENQTYSKAAVIQTFCVFVASIVLVAAIDIIGIAFARYIAITIAILFTLPVLKKYLAGVQSIRMEKREIQAFMVMSLSLMISNLFSLIMPINEMALINNLIRDEVVTANYKIAIMIPSQLSFITQSIVVYYFTIVARMENKKEIWKLSKKVGLFSAGVISVISLAGVLLSPWIIRLVYGSQYEDAIELSIVFWVVYAMNAGIRMVPMNFLPAIGIAKFNAIMAAVACVIHFVITYWALTRFGILGAGIATGIVYLGSGMVYWLYYRQCCLKE